MTKQPVPGAKYAREENWHPLNHYSHIEEGTEFDDLCAQIKEEGLLESVVLHEGLVIEGRMRAQACVRVGVPITIQYFTDDPTRGDDPATWLRYLHKGDRIPRTKDMAEYDEVHDPGRIPAGQFQCIVADPPWDVDHATQKYPTMPVDAIAAMAKHRPLCYRRDGTPKPTCKGCGVLQAAAEDCHLYLWAINARLRDGLDVLDAWGFRYVTQITWNKTRGEGIRSDGLVLPDHSGQGQGYRGATEQILVGVKGHLPWRTSHFDTQFYAPRLGGHSVKPDRYFWPMIMQVSPGPYLELFARRLWHELDAARGDAVWGNQAPKKAK